MRIRIALTVVYETSMNDLYFNVIIAIRRTYMYILQVLEKKKTDPALNLKYLQN